jgi:hypothetical protein
VISYWPHFCYRVRWIQDNEYVMSWKDFYRTLWCLENYFLRCLNPCCHSMHLISLFCPQQRWRPASNCFCKMKLHCTWRSFLIPRLGFVSLWHKRSLTLLWWGLRVCTFHSSPGSSELVAPGPSILASIISAGSCFPEVAGLAGLCWQISLFFMQLIGMAERTSGNVQ